MAAGHHLLLDFYNCREGITMDVIETTLLRAARATGATILFSHSHLFDDGGCSGVVVLAESHASYHYWWEERYMALDVFVCGNCDPSLAVPVLCDEFQPGEHSVNLQERGVFMRPVSSPSPNTPL